MIAFTSLGAGTDGYGYLQITASNAALQIDFHPLGHAPKPLDTTTVPIGP
jgi:hypothetical protein